ncbi:hypothetical protein BDN72DRAFT_847367 [Pluteus cervinus]|uniref:Uncharacterized protein n=1 Tax=Pluteus cervinus TaxID=181527 RepID=A0ACD3ADN1_9AGAR|nr:hypothetical protein BDN72DRAFT_847367 [Pluteus cervinus]
MMLRNIFKRVRLGRAPNTPRMLSRSQLSILSVLSLAVSSALGDEAYVGTAFHFVPGQGACGHVNNGTQLVGSVSRKFFTTYPGATANPNKNPLCHKKLFVQANKRSVIVDIIDFWVDNLPQNSVGLSDTAFKLFAPLDDGVVDVTWTVI